MGLPCDVSENEQPDVARQITFVPSQSVSGGVSGAFARPSSVVMTTGGS